MPTAADYFTSAGQGLGELSDTLYNIQDRREKDLNARADRAQSNALADPMIRKSLERIINGEDPEQVAIEHLVQQHIESQPSMTRNPSPGPFAAGYDNGPDTGNMIPYSQPATGSRLSSGPQLDTSTLRAGIDSGIQNKDVPELAKLGGMLSTERNRNAMMDYRYDNLGLGYDKLAAQRQKDAGLQELRDAQAALARARLAGMPMQEKLAQERLQVAWRKIGQQDQALGLQGQRINLSEMNQYMKGAGATVQTISQLRQIINEAKNTPGLQIPNTDFDARRKAEIAAELPIAGKALAKYINLEADKNLTPEQRTFKRQKLQSMVDYIHQNYGSQLTGGEMQWINAIAGEQLTWNDSIAALEALTDSLASRANIYGQAYPGAAARIQAPANPLPQIIQQPAGKPPGYRIEQLTPQQRQQWGVSNQQELDYINEQSGRAPVGNYYDSNAGGLDTLNYGYNPGP